MNIPKANNFAQHKPCVVLLLAEDLKTPESVLSDENDKPIVFERFTKARKHVANNIDSKLHHRITYANENPIAGAGDREATNNKKCLKCNGFLRPATGESIQLGNQTLETQIFVCPRCDA